MFNVIALLITVCYPLLIWLLHDRVEPRWLAGLLLLVVVFRLLSLSEAAKLGRFKVYMAFFSVIFLAVLAGVAMNMNALLPLKLYPVLVNALLLTSFSVSLVFPPSLIEIIARAREPDFPPEAVAYTRRVTQIWCGFFMINGAIALVTALWSTDAVWSLYTGVISYLLMGALFVGEYTYRWRFRKRIRTQIRKQIKEHGEKTRQVAE